MPKTHDTWTVLPHDRPLMVDEGILTVTGLIPMPLGNFPRRMTVVALAGGRSVIFSAMALDDAAMREVESLGTPTWLVVPDAAHRLDATAFCRKFPAIRVLAPPGSRHEVTEVVAVDATDADFTDPDIRFETLAGTAGWDSALVVRRPGGTTIIVNDMLANVRHPPGIGAQIMARLFGFGVDRPRVPRPMRGKIERPDLLAAQLREWAAIPDLRRIIVSHGDIIDGDPAAVLERVASGL